MTTLEKLYLGKYVSRAFIFCLSGTELLKLYVLYINKYISNNQKRKKIKYN